MTGCCACKRAGQRGTCAKAAWCIFPTCSCSLQALRSIGRRICSMIYNLFAHPIPGGIRQSSAVSVRLSFRTTRENASPNNSCQRRPQDHRYTNNSPVMHQDAYQEGKIKLTVTVRCDTLTPRLPSTKGQHVEGRDCWCTRRRG